MDIYIHGERSAVHTRERRREKKRNVDDPSFIVSSSILYFFYVYILSPEMRVTEKGGAMAKTSANEYVRVL